MMLEAKDIEAHLSDEGLELTTDALATAIEQYPYASILHFLYLRALQEEESFKFPAQLHRTAISAMDRQALLDWAEAPLIPVEVQAAAWSQSQGQSAIVQSDESSTQLPTEILEEAIAENGDEPQPVVEDIALPAAQENPDVQLDRPEALVTQDSTEPIQDPPVESSPEPSREGTESPQVPAPPTKAAGPTNLTTLNLDALPPAVREQILRSQAIQAQLGKAPAEVRQDAVAPAKPIVEIPTEDPPIADATVEVIAEKDSSQIPPEGFAQIQETSVESPLEIEPEPSMEFPEVEEETGSEDSSVGAAEVEDEKSLPISIEPGAAPKHSNFKSNPQLSPFANFLASLKETQAPVPVPKADRDVGMERAILEQFLEINPRIRPQRDAVQGENLALRTPNVSGLVTETLANHYYDQGIHEKAIQAYEILKLKVPEKSAIFAARISEMRQIQSSKK